MAIIKGKALKRILTVLFVVLLIPTIAPCISSAQDTVDFSVSSQDETVTILYPIVLTENRPYAGIQIDLTVSDPNFLTLNSYAITGSYVESAFIYPFRNPYLDPNDSNYVKGPENTYRFGFYSSGNDFSGADRNIGTLAFTYKGTGAQSFTLKVIKIWHFPNDGDTSAVMREEIDYLTVNIKRANTGGDTPTPTPTPGGDTPSPTPVPGGGSSGGGGGGGGGTIIEAPPIEIGEGEVPRTGWRELMSLEAGAGMEDGIVAFDAADGATKFVPFSLVIDGAAYFFGEPDVDYYLKPNPKKFSDIGGHWAYDNIIFTASREVFQGYEDNSFKPNAQMTRAMFATVLARMAMVDVGSYTSRVFSDVDPGAWYGPHVAWAYDNGIVLGVGDNKFNPNGNISRQDMVLMITRFLDALEIELLDRGDPGAFADEGQIGDWASGAVTEMRKYGIVQGKAGNMFDPRGNSTRAEVATVVYRIVESSLSNQLG